MTVPTRQRGGFALGLIVGLLVGLAVALGVALYIAKVPSPFHDKVPHRTPEQEAAEAEKLRNWDPNAGLGGKPVPAKPAASALPAYPEAPAAQRPAPASAPAAAAPRSQRDAAAILSGEPVPPPPLRAPAATPGPARPPAGDAFVYYVQAGAFSSADDAEQQRARLALQGFGAKVHEREQSGRVVHRVRLGPYDSQAEATTQQERLKAAGIDAALVRLERN
ncbi:SPOR domain-containing protein [Ideonella sp.]|uniref:SPOR domain-containing protein n=1 Tax=Ideonella sp. TaxID=1929293 RepID=UPI0035AF1C23